MIGVEQTGACVAPTDGKDSEMISISTDRRRAAPAEPFNEIELFFPTALDSG